MSMGNNPADSAPGKLRSEQLMAQADADRAARLAGRKSLFRRMLERLRPYQQEPDGDSHSSYGIGGRNLSGTPEVGASQRMRLASVYETK
jgi:hypothetical protein